MFDNLSFVSFRTAPLYLLNPNHVTPTFGPILRTWAVCFQIATSLNPALANMLGHLTELLGLSLHHPPVP